MSKLDNLLEELCPFGVEYTELIENVEIINGFSFKSNEYSNEGLRVIRISDVQKGVISDKDIKYYPVKYESELSQFILRDGDLLMSLTGNVGRVAMLSSIHLPAALNQRVACLRPKSGRILARFLFHFLNQDKFEQIAIQNSTGGGQKNLSTTWLAKFKIQIPPLEVQQEIVRILDNFTELTSELTSELTARRNQYEYYRDSLFSFKDRTDIAWLSLSEIAVDMFRGSGIKRDEVTEEGIPCVRYGEIYTTYGIWFDKCRSHTKLNTLANPKYFEHGDVLFAITGENVEEIAKSCVYIGHERCLAGGDIVVMKHNQNPKYISYVLSTNMAQKQKSKGKVKSKVVHSSIPALKEIVIPIPTLEEQARIVSILDRFDTLVNDIKQGLPAEIAARQKQYEYYRDKLLTFKEVGDESI